jgi:large subunit ribosomal protein L28
MAAVCQLCDKKPWFGKQVSHSHRRSSRRWSPNIQRVTAYVDGRSVKLQVCTSCLKAGKVQRPPVKSAGADHAGPGARVLASPLRAAAEESAWRSRPTS